MIWVSLYTRGLDNLTRDSRRAEISSDLWEHKHFNTVNSVRPAVTAASVVARLVAGVPSDISWRHQQRHTLNAPSHKGVLMTTHRAWPFTRIIIVLHCIFIAGFALLVVVSGENTNDAAVFLLAVCATSLTGLGVRSRHPGTGVSLICCSSFSVMFSWWWSPLLFTGALVIVMTLITAPWDHIEDSGWSADDALQRLREGPISEPIRVVPATESVQHENWSPRHPPTRSGSSV